MIQKKRMSGEERKNQIVEAAIKIFSKKGFQGAKTKEIANAACISEAMIFRHFKNKDDLYKSIIKTIRKSPSEEIAALQSQSNNISEVLKKIILKFLEEMEKNPSLIRLMLYSSLEESRFAFNYVEENLVGTMAAFTSILKKGIERGEFRDVNPELAAQSFSSMIGGYCISQYVFKQTKIKTFDRKEVAETYVDIFLNGLKKHK